VFFSSRRPHTSSNRDWSSDVCSSDLTPIDMGMGGSIPFISTLTDAFPSASVLVTGVEDPDTRAHGTHESLHLAEWARACEAEAILLQQLGGLPAQSLR